MNIIEAKRPKSMDTTGFKDNIKTVMHKLSAGPFSLHFNRDWADRLIAAVDEYVAKMDDEDKEYFVAKEYLFSVADKLWEGEKDHLIPVRANIEYAEQEYQKRASERHGYEDDLNNWIESSNYLSGMDAMKSCAQAISMIHDISNPQSTKQILDSLENFAGTWDDNVHVTDGGEEPILDEDFVYVIERLLPLLGLILR